MTISRIKSPNWAVSEVFTSAQANALDANVTNAVDKRLGNSDTVQSSLTFNTGTVVLAGSTTVSGTSQLTNVQSLSMTSTNRVTYTSRSLIKFFPLIGLTFASGDWRSTNGPSMQNVNVGQTLTLPFDLPISGAVLNSVTARFKGATGHGALPAIMPQLKVFRYDTNGTATQLGSTATDPSASVAAFETVVHDIAVTAIAHTIDGTVNRYGCQLIAESSTNSLTGGEIFALIANITVTAQAEL